MGFDTLKDNPSEGVDILYQCARDNKLIFVDKLANNMECINILEDLLEDKSVQKNLVIDLLNVYYEQNI